MRAKKTYATPSRPPSAPRQTALAVLVILAVGVAIYWGSLSTPFVFDEREFIVDHFPLQRYWPPWAPLVDSNRPVGFLSFAANLAWHGTDPWGYHVVNLAIHLAAAAVLFGIVRRTLMQSKRLAARYGQVAWGLALAVAVVWMAHPLQTQSVTYIYQRLESLMGLFYLLTLYFFIRGVNAARPGGWYAASIFCCALGMGTKEVMVTAPLMVLWYDRALVASSWREIINDRARYFAALAGTWSILAVIMLSQVDRYTEGDVLVVRNVSPSEYALSQPGVILHYLRLSFWPTGLCLDYARPVARSADEIVPPLVVIGALGAATLWSMTARPAWGLVGGWFFVILAPTSSIAPIKDLAFEHRMYLPLVSVVVLAVVGGFEAWRRLVPRLATSGPAGAFLHRVVPAAAVAAAVAALGMLTVIRNRDYESMRSIWQDTVDKRPANARAHNNLGNAVFDEGEYTPALALYDKAIELDSSYTDRYINRGNVYRTLDQPERAIADYNQALKMEPGSAEAYKNRALAFQQLHRYAEAIADYSHAIELRPDFAENYYNRAVAYHQSGQSDRASADLDHAIKLNPDYAEAYHNRGYLLYQSGEYERAMMDYNRAIELKPDYAEAYNNRGNTRVQSHRHQAALDDYSQAIRLKPDYAEAYLNRGILHYRLKRYQRAVEDYTKAIERMPRPAQVYHARAMAYYKLKQHSQAWADVTQVRKLGGKVSSQFIKELAEVSGRSASP